MAKPIVLVSLVKHGTQQEADAQMREVSEMLTAQLLDYHVIVMRTNTLEDNKFQVFNVKYLREIEYEELKVIVEESLKRNQTENG